MNHLLPVFMFAVAAVITPGPNNIVIFNSALHRGLGRTLPVYAGICLGFPLLFIVIGLGLGEVFMHYPPLQYLLKIIGAVYLLVLAYQIAVQPNEWALVSGVIPSSFVGGMLFQWINPKAWLIAIGAISAYMPAGAGFLEIFGFALVFLGVTIPCVGVWLLLGLSAQSAARTGAHMSLLNKLMGLLLAASVLPVVWALLRSGWQLL